MAGQHWIKGEHNLMEVDFYSLLHMLVLISPNFLHTDFVLYYGFLQGLCFPLPWWSDSGKCSVSWWQNAGSFRLLKLPLLSLVNLIIKRLCSDRISHFFPQKFSNELSAFHSFTMEFRWILNRSGTNSSEVHQAWSVTGCRFLDSCVCLLTHIHSTLFLQKSLLEAFGFNTATWTRGAPSG